MNAIHDVQVAALIQKVDTFGNAHGSLISLAVEKNAHLSLHWLQYLNLYHRTGTADELLDAFASSIREAAACNSIGLVRPALFSMRTQIDLILSWLYFKDHSVEWGYINRSGDGFKLKRELLEYFNVHCKGFGTRYGILKEVVTRREEDTYRLLSAHIHGQSNAVLPVTMELADVVRDKALCDECASLVGEVAEYVHDILAAFFSAKWSSLSVEITSQIESRFTTDAQKQRFFASI